MKGGKANIVTINGQAAYGFAGDGSKPPQANCVSYCLVAWPPVLTDGSKIESVGIDPKLVGTVKRSDGFEQVTLGGRPLYRFNQDKAKTDTKGQGVGGNWFVVRPDGRPVIPKKAAGSTGE
ncbi:hypothetical protein [Streptomyces sp. NPDC056661]|uniref:COG4315 family predicted lipoprotein n=1 Tax=Streptomyces sp. NPDC056661 TaxID=3345898 RepID=UPI003685DC80